MRNLVLALILALALVATGCSDDPADGSTSSAASSTTAEPPTSGATEPPEPTSTSAAASSTTTTPATTTTEPGPVSALNGLPIADESLLERRVIAVKIDDHPNARPQSGLLEAEAVVEILVEGGFTRFISLFHTASSDYLGPVRSGRPTDAGILRPLDGVFAISGAQDWVARYLVRRDIRLMAEGVEGFFRIGGRVAPHNLYADTEGLRKAADGYGFDDTFGIPLYEIGEWAEVPDEAATEISLSWDPAHVITWEYSNGSYLRSEGGREHAWIAGRDGTPEQIAVDVLVVLVGRRSTASPPAGESGTAVPATETVGSGSAYVFSQGRVLRGTWSRSDIDRPFDLVAEDGSAMTVPPGLPWISVFPDTRPIDWS